ncbi:MAG TPA: DNA gyrase inhibitor YacG [Aestuariivirgaceae bacterium]|nr:DNA gyrase inhibitor YacG [Aestuariivirgaceae bacterium]
MQKFHPFCSARCAQVDLNRWLGGNYAIPAVETEEPSEGDLDKEK